jgi:hypothetical protein
LNESARTPIQCWLARVYPFFTSKQISAQQGSCGGFFTRISRALEVIGFACDCCLLHDTGLTAVTTGYPLLYPQKNRLPVHQATRGGWLRSKLCSGWIVSKGLRMLAGRAMFCIVDPVVFSFSPIPYKKDGYSQPQSASDCCDELDLLYTQAELASVICTRTFCSRSNPIILLTVMQTV